MAINAYVYASLDYATKETSYGVATINKKGKDDLGIVKLEYGLWDGKPWEGENNPPGRIVLCTSCESLNELVLDIRRGAEEYEFPDLRFLFDYPDNLDVSFWRAEEDQHFTAVDNLLRRYRPLNEEERQQFAKAFADLSGK